MFDKCKFGESAYMKKTFWPCHKAPCLQETQQFLNRQKYQDQSKYPRLGGVIAAKSSSTKQ